MFKATIISRINNLIAHPIHTTTLHTEVYYKPSALYEISLKTNNTSSFFVHTHSTIPVAEEKIAEHSPKPNTA